MDPEHPFQNIINMTLYLFNGVEYTKLTPDQYTYVPSEYELHIDMLSGDLNGLELHAYYNATIRRLNQMLVEMDDRFVAYPEAELIEPIDAATYNNADLVKVTAFYDWNDFFVKPDGSVLVNELNTIPGFTNISMYPKLWEASGIPCRELVHRLIQLGIERFRREEAKSRDWDAPPPEGS